jgi:hypothetical protein
LGRSAFGISRCARVWGNFHRARAARSAPHCSRSISPIEHPDKEIAMAYASAPASPVVLLAMDMDDVEDWQKRHPGIRVETALMIADLGMFDELDISGVDVGSAFITTRAVGDERSVPIKTALRGAVATRRGAPLRVA